MTKTHRHSHPASPTYRSWRRILTRCFNPKHDSYARYGGRGIRVCERWLTFENFLADMGERPAGLTIERKDNEGHYEPGNCVWANAAEQARNRRTNKLTPVDVAHIKAASQGTNWLARWYGVSPALISRIRNDLTWRD